MGAAGAGAVLVAGGALKVRVPRLPNPPNPPARRASASPIEAKTVALARIAIAAILAKRETALGISQISCHALNGMSGVNIGILSAL
jgi:hypothetical protein